VVRYKAKDVVK